MSKKDKYPVSVYLDYNTDKKIIALLESKPNKSAYIREALNIIAENNLNMTFATINSTQLVDAYNRPYLYPPNIPNNTQPTITQKESIEEKVAREKAEKNVIGARSLIQDEDDEE